MDDLIETKEDDQVALVPPKMTCTMEQADQVMQEIGLGHGPATHDNVDVEGINLTQLMKLGAFVRGQGVVSLGTCANTFWGPQWALAAMGLGFDLVRPKVWQKALCCMTGGDKNVSKAKAQQLWPNTKWIHATSDAALICEYGRRMELRGGA